MPPLKVGFLTPAASRLGGGVSSALSLLANSLKRTGDVEPVVFSTDDQFLEEDRRLFTDIEIVARPQFGPRSFGYSPLLASAIRPHRIDILHLHGVWTHTSVVGLSWARSTGRPYIVSPHGMLEPWILSRGRWKKRLARAAYESQSLVRANVVHALTRAEEKDILAFAPKASVRVIPNGIELDQRGAPARRQDLKNPYFLYLGRLHPKKNLESLLEAWRSVGIAGRTGGYRLVVAGYGDADYVDGLLRLIEATNKHAPVEYVGSAYGEFKRVLLSKAGYLVLSSFSEGLPMVVLEAWSHATPVIMTEACNMQRGFERGAAMRIGVTPGEIQAVLQDATVLPGDAWGRYSESARSLVLEEFSADAIAEHWVELYREMAAAGVPAC